METINKINNINNYNENNIEQSKIQKNTIREELDDEELDESYRSNKPEKTEIPVNNQQYEINDEDDMDDFIEQKNISFENDVEEDEEFIDFNNNNAYDSDENLDENNDFQNNKEVEEKEEEEIKNADANQLSEDKVNNLENEIKNNILAKKNTATSRLKTVKKKKQSEADKRKKFYEDPRETKTIFSKISEEIFYKLSKDKYKKSSAYDFMTSDIYINRVVQKSDQDNKNKFNSFLERNNEFFNKKKLRLNEKIQKISDETYSDLYAIPNKKVFNKDELRNAQQFFEDQKNFVLQKQQYVEAEREEKLKKNIIESQNNIPEINKNSKNIAEKKINDKTQVFERLHNQKNYKEKQMILNEITSIANAENNNHKNNVIKEVDNNNNLNKNLSNENGNFGTNKTSAILKKLGINTKRFSHVKPALKLKGFKKPKSQMQSYSNKLHDDAKKLQSKMEERKKLIFNKEAPDLQCKKTKLMNIEKFIKSYNRNIKRIIKQKNYNNENQINNNTNDFKNAKIDFNDYCKLLHNMGFIKHDCETIKFNLENNNYEKSEEANYTDKKLDLKDLNEKLVNPNKKQKLMQKLIKTEARLVFDSWNVLISKAPKAQQINEISEIEEVDQKEVLIFLCVVQGFLKGDVEKISKEEENEMQQIKQEKINRDKFDGKINIENKLNKSSKSVEKSETFKANLLRNAANNKVDHSIEIKNGLYSDINKIRNNLVLSDDEDNAENKCEFENYNAINGEFNKFKRVKSKDSINKFLRKSSEMINNFEENVENKYKRKKSKNNDNFITNLNDKELNIPTDNFLNEEKNLRDNNLDNPSDLLNTNQNRMRSIIKSASKEKQRSVSSNNNRKHPNALAAKDNFKSNLNKKELTNPNILTENSDGIKDANKKGDYKIDDVYIINKFFKLIELKNYTYNRITAKKIKIIFRMFLENRTEHLISNKLHNIKDDEDSDLAQESHAAYKIRDNKPIEKFKNKFYYERFKQRVINQLENEMTFKPELNTSTNQSNINNVVSNKRKKLKMEDAYEYQRKKKESELMKLRMLKEEEEMKNCTFQPNKEHFKTNNRKNLNLNTLVDKLYKEGLSQIKEKKILAKKHEAELIEKEVDPKKITFKPSIIILNESIFNPKKIEAYEVSKKNVERFERARIEKKIAEIQKQTGITNLNQINNIDALLKENNYPSWNFTLEKKSHKDTFDDTSRFSKLTDRKNDNQMNIINTFNTINTLTNSFNYTNTNSNNDQAIFLDVNLNEDSSFKKLKIGLYDDPKIIAEEFAKKYDLSEEKKLNLIMLIEEKINESRLNMYTQGSKQ